MTKKNKKCEVASRLLGDIHELEEDSNKISDKEDRVHFKKELTLIKSDARFIKRIECK